MAINVTISTGGKTTAVTIPEVKNTVQVTGGNITQAERDKLAGIEAGATTDQTLTGGDNINVSESGGDYTINLDNTIDISGDATLTNAFVDKVLIRDTSSNQLPGNIGAAHFYVDTTGNTQLVAKPSTDLKLKSSQDVDINHGNSGQTTIGDIQGTERITLSGTGLTVKASSHEFTFSTAGKLGIGKQSTYYMPVNASGASIGDGLKYGVGGQLEFGSVGADLSTSILDDIGDVTINSVVPSNATVRTLTFDTFDNKWKFFADLGTSLPSPVAGVANISFASPTTLQAIPGINFDGANDALSINSTVSYGASGVNLFVDGKARIDGAIEVSSAGTVQYSLPTADGTANQVLATDGSGAVTFVTPSTSNVTEGTNLYYTDSRVAANSAVAANTAKTSFPGFGTTAGTALEGNTALFDGQYSSLTGVPSTFAPSAHTHTASEITDFDTEVSNNTSVAANTAKISYPTADSTKVGFISVTQAVDLDTMESDIATNNAKVGYTDAAVDSRIAAASIDDLSDVDTSTVAPTDGQALVWDNANSKWEPGTVSGGGGGGGGLGSADQTLTADRTIDTNGYNLDIELDPTGTPDTFTIHDGTHDLFQVDTSTTGTIFSVNDVSGLPKLTVDDSDGVTIDKFKEVKYEKPSNTDFSYQGDVVYFGATTGMTQGDLYYYNSSGNWAQADADAASSSGGVLLAIALGTASDTNGMLLKGAFTMAAGAIDGTEATGDELYVSTTAGHVTSAAPTATGDIVRVVGYMLDGTNGQIWFNPSNDFITLA